MTEKQPSGEWQLAETAKKHGTDNEELAKRAFIEVMRPHNPKILEDGEKTKLSLFFNSSHRTSAFIMTTPDMILTLRPEKELYVEKVVAEFKCPYFEIFSPSLRNNRGITLVATDYMYKHPHGRESSFIQTLVYALTENVSKFFTCYYFTDHMHEAMVIYTYEMPEVDTVSAMIMEAMVDIKEQLGKEPGDIKVRTSSVQKRKMTEIMKVYSKRADVYEMKEDGNWHHLNADSDEETSDDSEDEGPCEPGEVRRRST